MKMSNITFEVARSKSGVFQKYHVIWVVAFLATGVQCVTHIAVQPNNAVSMSGQCRERWANITTILSKWHVYAWDAALSIQQMQCWSIVGPA